MQDTDIEASDAEAGGVPQAQVRCLPQSAPWCVPPPQPQLTTNCMRLASPGAAQNGLSEAPAQQDGGSPKDESEPPTVAEEEAEPDAAIGQPAFDPAFAPLSAPFMFWQDALLLALLGGCMGAFG